MADNSLNPLISIIVPVFNAARFLPMCLDSVLNQDFTNWEILLVDDGSTDESPLIIESYATKDARIHTLFKKNGGVSSARNLGMDNAKGEWIIYLDADDRLKHNALSQMESRTGGVDSVFGGYEVFDEEGKLTYAIQNRHECELDKYQALELLFRPWHYRALGAVWAKLFKLSVIRDNGLRFNESIHIGEDRLFVFEFLCHAGGVNYFTAPVYEYVENPTSAMASYNKGKNSHFITDLDAFLEMERCIKFLPNHEEVLSLLKKNAVYRFHQMNETYSTSGWDRVILKMKTHWRLLRILSLKDYCRYVLKNWIISRLK